MSDTTKTSRTTNQRGRTSHDAPQHHVPLLQIPLAHAQQIQIRKLPAMPPQSQQRKKP